MASRAGGTRWYRSFYLRIGASFVVFVVALLTAQTAIFNYRIARAPFPGRSPRALAAIIAADLGAILAQDPKRDIQGYLTAEYGRLQQSVHVVMRDGRVFGNDARALDPATARTVAAQLSGRDSGWRLPAGASRPPAITAPILAGNDLQGMVVLVPPVIPGPFRREFVRLISLPGSAVLVVLAIAVAFVIFAPARRRLAALERATRQLGAGDPTARAPDHGGDEIARVAAAFNRMAVELAEREDALRNVDRLRRQMLADVSHELRTPLTAMRGYVETLRMSDVSLDAATRERYFATLDRETQRLDRIVNDLVDLARLENGVVSFEPRVFDLHRLIAHVVARHEQEAVRRGVSFDVRIGEGADQLFADPDRIEQAVENLVANALRHSPDGAPIELETSAGPRRLALSVVDAGDGVPPEHLAHIFDRFYKVDASRSNGSGSGLGLSIVKAIVDRHGGTIDVKSVKGRTAFTVTLPQG